MKRSEINQLIDENIALLAKRGISFQPQAYWNLETWYEHRASAEETRKRGIGWDLTDWGSGDFYRIGLLLYTIANGIIDPKTGMPLNQSYAQKLLIARENQVIPTHHHWSKMEDIIVLARGELDIKLHNATSNDKLDAENEVRIMRNNIWEVYPQGTVISLAPGERIRV